MSEGYGAGDQVDPRTLGYGHEARGRRDREPTGQPESMATLLSGLLGDLQDLVRGEMTLARAEIREDAMAAGRGLAMIAGGALVGAVGFIFLMLGVTYLLNKWMQMWIAALIVGAVLAIIAAIVAMNGRGKLSASNLAPDQTIASLKEDQEWARQQVSSVNR